ncbi:MAG: 30S ribosomal protein S20 [Candidatus Eremiobacteraeota bacterium]|nr:30S ribosomal protein S20 [Candidatus Eremiobacteraeota bacterium]
MPNIKAAEKWSRQTVKRTTRNKDAATRLKTLYRKAVSSGDTAGAAVESAYDKAAGKGIIHPNKAARKKSRLAKAIARATATPVKPVRTKTSRSSKSRTAKKTAKK